MSCCGQALQTAYRGALGIARVVLRVNPASAATMASRLAECRHCPHSSKRERDGQIQVKRCRLCGCWIKLKVQDAEPAEECERWKKSATD